ncbi:MAG TPA: NAD(P)/FAD-dependent oxidoreductase [Chlamydiales bacterium]|nr:NAD(P)/FAD-dependent oxidoreductase [Chlamydiales bacterium]
MRIAVVGGGLAGLTAAYRIEQKTGHSVTLYEARKRLGGRVQTIYLGDAYEELGGRFFRDGGPAKNIKALIKEMKLDIDSYDADVTHRKYVYKGQLGTYYDLFRHTPPPNEATFSQLQEIAEKATNFGQILDQFFANQEILRHLFEIRMRGFEGSDSHLLSTAYLEVFWNAYKESYQFCHYAHPKKEYFNDSIMGGNELLINKLAQSIKGKIHLNSPLQKVSQTEKGNILLHFAKSQPIETDYLILTLPLTILKDIPIQLPLDQKQAIENIQYGSNSKILLPITFGNDLTSEFSATEDAALWFNRERTIMTLYFGGKEGLISKDTLTQKVEKEKKALKLLFPSLTISTPILINWKEEEYSKGSYSNWSPTQYDLMADTTTSWGEPVMTIFRPIQDKIFFAGEHTAIEHSATMEGAVESGERTARMIAKAIKRA